MRSATVLHPQRLTPRGAAQLIRRLAPETSAAVCRDCHRAVGGNPWLLGELGRQIATHGPEVIDRGRRRRAARLRDRPQRHPLAAGHAGAPRPGGGRRARGPRRRRAPARRGDPRRRRGQRAGPGPRRAAGRRPARSRRRAPGPRPGGRRGRGGPHRDRVRAHAPRGRARVDGRPRGRRPRRQPPAPVPPAGRSGASAGCWCTPRRPRRAAGRRTPRRRTSSARCRSTRRATTAGACSRSSRPSPSTPACPTRSAACSTRCPRCAIARAGSTCSRAWPRSTSSARGDADHAELFERELACESDPDARLAVEAASLDALMMIPERNLERARRAAAIDLHRDDGSRCSSACSSPTAPGSGSSSARPTRPRAPRWRSRRSRATCCCARPAGARPTTCACGRWS